MDCVLRRVADDVRARVKIGERGLVPACKLEVAGGEGGQGRAEELIDGRCPASPRPFPLLALPLLSGSQN